MLSRGDRAGGPEERQRPACWHARCSTVRAMDSTMKASLRREALLSAGMTGSVMTRLRWASVALAFLGAMAISCGMAAGADKTKVDQATKRVERGAKMIGK